MDEQKGVCENIQVQVLSISRTGKAADLTVESVQKLCKAFMEQRILAHKKRKNMGYNYQQTQIQELKNTFKEFRNIHSQVPQDVEYPFRENGEMARLIFGDTWYRRCCL